MEVNMHQHHIPPYGSVQYMCTATTAPQSGEEQEMISRKNGSEEGACTSTFLINFTPSQPVHILIVEVRKHMHTFPVGNIVSDGTRKRFKRILNFWDSTTRPESNPAEPRMNN